MNKEDLEFSIGAKKKDNVELGCGTWETESLALIEQLVEGRPLLVFVCLYRFASVAILRNQ